MITQFSSYVDEEEKKMVVILRRIRNVIVPNKALAASLTEFANCLQGFGSVDSNQCLSGTGSLLAQVCSLTSSVCTITRSNIFIIHISGVTADVNSGELYLHWLLGAVQGILPFVEVHLHGDRATQEGERQVPYCLWRVREAAEYL